VENLLTPGGDPFAVIVKTEAGLFRERYVLSLFLFTDLLVCVLPPMSSPVVHCQLSILYGLQAYKFSS